MPTVKYRVLYHDGRDEAHEAELPEADAERALKPSDNQRKRWAIVREITQAIIGLGKDVEHVRVWHEGKYLDMFVDETGVLDQLPLNTAATAVYRANWMAHEPNPGPVDELPIIAGDAVLFLEKVWG